MRHVRSCVEVLSRREIERIHRASLEILGELGVQVPNDRLLQQLRSLGARVSGDTVFLSEAIVSRVVEEFAGRRKGKRSGRWALSRGNLSADNASQRMMVDYPGYERRPGTLDDVVKGIVLTNALPTIRSALPVVVPSDVPAPVAEIEAYLLGCLYSAKPFHVFFNLNLRACSYLMEMAKIGAQAASRPLKEYGFGFGFGVISPLRFSPDDLECALMTSAQGFPTSCYSFVVVGATSPASMAGALAMGNAERLACLTMMWLWNGMGRSADDGGEIDDPCMIDPQTLAASFGHPNLTTLAIANGQLSRFYGLGPGGALALTDAKMVDFQAGFERGMGASFCMLAGLGVGPSGIAGTDEGTSLEKMVIDDAAVSALNWVGRGIEVTEESLALDVIKDVGIGGNYMDRRHTAEYLRKEYWTSLFPRQSWSDWEEDRATLMERAHGRVQRVLEEGYPPPSLVSDDAARRLRDVAARARSELYA